MQTRSSFSALARLEIIVGGVSVALGLVGYLLECSPLELLGIIGAVFSLGVVVTRTLLHGSDK